MRVFLAVSALVWLPYGLWCFARPEILAAFAGLAATTPTAIAEVRAMYGGLQIAIGVLAVVALARPHHRRSVVLTLGLLTGGLGIARLLAVLLGAGVSGYTAGGLIVEFGSMAWAAALLRR
jgi:hypothetical protein